MATVALSGDDSVIINNRPMMDVADGNYGELTFPNDIANVKTGKNGNSIYSSNATGNQGEFKLRLIRGSADDKFLLSLMSAQKANFPGTVLLISEIIKKLGDGQGNISNDTYLSTGGVFKKQIEVKSNAEGDTDQSVALYTIVFSNVVRVIT
jgi:hypothetical protein